MNPLKTRPPVTGRQQTRASEGQGAPGLRSARGAWLGACEPVLITPQAAGQPSGRITSHAPMNVRPELPSAWAAWPAPSVSAPRRGRVPGPPAGLVRPRRRDEREDEPPPWVNPGRAAQPGECVVSSPRWNAVEVQHGAPGTSVLVGPDASSNSEQDLLPLGLDFCLSPVAVLSGA